ncbi:MAG: GntR family transcriptional regulator [Spirochaetia bacterium]|nr:GntR family transcriptional regulator [Spirochaetia bacterium]MCF7941508.1 GntR family transcriptional regulator [Spirochaetia bacterium]
MEFTKLSTPSLKQLFVEQIERMILSGTLEIGQQLPSERELAVQMGISRTVVNAGIAEMEGKGFLEVRPRVGIFVTDFRRYGTVGTIVALMNCNGGIMRAEEIKSILELRLAFDRLSVENLVRYATDEQIDSLKPFLDAIGSCSTPAEYARALYSYHHELSILTQNTIMPLIYSSFSYPLTCLWERYCRLYGGETLYESTCALYELIRLRKREEAIAWIEEYIGASIDGSRQIYRD